MSARASASPGRQRPTVRRAFAAARFASAPRDSFDDFSRWLPAALVEHVQNGDATLSVYANDPDLLANQPVDLVTSMGSRLLELGPNYRVHPVPDFFAEVRHLLGEAAVA